MKAIKIGAGERVNATHRQFLIFNDEDKTFFTRAMMPLAEYDFCKVLKIERLKPEETEKRLKTYKQITKTQFVWPKRN